MSELAKCRTIRWVPFLRHRYNKWSFIDPSDNSRHVTIQYRTCQDCGRVERRFL